MFVSTPAHTPPGAFPGHATLEVLWQQDVSATVFARGMPRLAMAAAVLSIAICTYGVWAIGTGFVSF